LSFNPGLAKRAALQAMNQPFPQWPVLLFEFVPPSRPEHPFLSLWIADAHGRTPVSDGLEEPEQARYDFAVNRANVQQAFILFLA
jgi:hypothetical protein